MLFAKFRSHRVKDEKVMTEKFGAAKFSSINDGATLGNYNYDKNDNLKKNSRLNDQINSSLVRCLVHLFDVHCTTTTWNLLIWRFMRNGRCRTFPSSFWTWIKSLRGSLPKSGPLDFATKNTFPLFFVGEEALVGVY